MHLHLLYQNFLKKVSYIIKRQMLVHKYVYVLLEIGIPLENFALMTNSKTEAIKNI